MSETASAEGFVSRHDEQDSPTSQLDAAQQELQSHGSGCSSNAAMPEFERAGPIEGKALGDEVSSESRYKQRQNAGHLTQGVWLPMQALQLQNGEQLRQ